ncbi:hypothetical protein A6U86_33005 [Rhizobium sp. AC27/96]|nr:hypothetical protein A6U86_33005 [Rhizobium sp. AC27/96]
MDIKIRQKNQTVAVEVRAGRKPADIKSVQQAFALKNRSYNFDRAMVISKAGFLARTPREAESLGLGEIDLLGMVLRKAHQDINGIAQSGRVSQTPRP